MTAPDTRVLLRDGMLRVEAAPGCLPLVQGWLPLLPYPERTAADGAVLRIARGGLVTPPPGPATLRLTSAEVWVDGSEALFAGTAGCSGHADLAAGVAELRAPGDTEAMAWEIYSMATLASALLLGRMGRTLAHAAAVVAPDGRAWLLVGDTHAGKSTTVANLLEGGWRFVSDDNVVLARGEGGIEVEGWPRHFHMDEGWRDGAPVGRRGALDPHELWPGRWLAAAPLAGLLFPRVEANAPTAVAPLAQAGALGGLLRQSPWLLADRGSAPAVLALLRDAAALPTYELRLGLDSYTDPQLLIDRVRPVME